MNVLLVFPWAPDKLLMERPVWTKFANDGYWSCGFCFGILRYVRVLESIFGIRCKRHSLTHLLSPGEIEDEIGNYERLGSDVIPGDIFILESREITAVREKNQWLVRSRGDVIYLPSFDLVKRELSVPRRLWSVGNQPLPRIHRPYQLDPIRMLGSILWVWVVSL